jgi:guanylate cyclase
MKDDLIRAGMPDWLRQLVVVLTGIGSRPSDSDAERLQKSLLVGGSLLILPAAIIWGAFYVVFDEPVAGAITLGYAAISALSILYLATSGRRQPATFAQLSCTLILPFLLTLILGGFMNSSLVILGALMTPLGALLYANSRHAARWFGAYVILVVAAGLLSSDISRPNNLPEWLIIALTVLNITIVSGLAFFMLNSFIAQKDRALYLLGEEQKRSERLLLNILPAKIAALLKVSDETIAERFDSVSVLFADVVGFTELSARMDAAELVELLNQVFSYFDDLAERYAVEKIRTIGDNYMVAAGVPESRPDHAQALAWLALDMMDYVGRYPGRNRQLQFRIGINSGPAVAGVIGQRKFQYDLWGDTVNVASRMESQSQPGKIQISRSTYALLGDEFVCRPRGPVEIKGKGQMETWFLTAAKS